LDLLFGNPPFFITETTGGITHFKGIGGANTIRGIPEYRYLGNIKLIVSPEIRCRIWDFNISGLPYFNGPWHIELVGFTDIGNVWQSLNTLNLSFHISYGIGLKILWEEDSIYSFDFSFWNGKFGGVYIGFGHHY